MFSKVQRKNADMLTNALDRTVVNTWSAMLDAFYLDPSNPNPFEEPAPGTFTLLPRLLPLNAKTGVTLDDLKYELTRLDSSLRTSGTFYPHETTPSQFILQALEVEDQQ
jgi:hypothetical protein